MVTTAPGIRARVIDARIWDSLLRETVWRPMIADVNSAIRRANQDYISIRNQIVSLPDDPRLRGLAQSSAEVQMSRLKAYHTKRFTTTMRKYLGVNVNFMSDAVVEPAIRRGIQESVDLIVTIPQRLHGDLGDDLLQLAQTKPFDEQELTKVLRKNYKSSGYNLRRLSRDQTNKAIGRLTEARQRQAGVDQYIWQDSGDASVRPSHRDNSGQTFSWDNPPVGTGHPGEDIQCRCVALAIILGLL